MGHRLLAAPVVGYLFIYLFSRIMVTGYIVFLTLKHVVFVLNLTRYFRLVISDVHPQLLLMC